MVTSKKLAILYQHMSPTRVPVFDELYKLLGDNLMVFYPAIAEGDRNKGWETKPHHPFTLLKQHFVSYTLYSMKRYVHFNLDIIPSIKRFNPDCVIIYGFHPTALLVWLYAVLTQKKIIIATDGCLKSDRYKTFLHLIIRKIVIKTADAVLGTSKNSKDLFNQYGNFENRYFNCYLVIDNEMFSKYRGILKTYDVMFSGQLIERKLPIFFVDVVEKLLSLKNNISVLIIGDGPLKNEMESRLKKLGVNYYAPGHLSKEHLPQAYSSSRILLFPSKLDAFGVVANEALAVGTPVISNDEPGAANEVIIHGVTGFVLPLDSDIWAAYVNKLLDDRILYKDISDSGYKLIQKYNSKNAAEGVMNALTFVYSYHKDNS